MRRDGENDPKTREDYQKLLPAECKEQCKDAVWFTEAFWAGNCVNQDFGATPCAKALCSSLSGTSTCEECIVFHEFGDKMTDADKAEFRKASEEGTKEYTAECKKLGHL